MEFKLTTVRMFVTDWERAIDFYTETLGIATVFRDDKMGWAQLDTGACQLALERTDTTPEGDATLGRFTGASLDVSDIQATYSILVERGVDISAPSQQYWGGWLADFKDPDGNIITLVQKPS